MWLELKNLVTCQVIVKRKIFLWRIHVYVEFSFHYERMYMETKADGAYVSHVMQPQQQLQHLSFAISSSLSCVFSMTSFLQFPWVLLSIPHTFKMIFSAQSCECMPSSCTSHVISFISLIVSWEMHWFWNLAPVKSFEIKSELSEGQLNDRQPVQMVNLTYW